MKDPRNPKNLPTKEFLKLVSDELELPLHRSTIPIMSQKDRGRAGPMVIGGTGVLLAVDDARFIVSASHVLAYDALKDVPLFVPVGVGLAQRIRGDFILSNDDDKVDLGIVRLDDEFARKMETFGAQFLRTAQLEFVGANPLPDGGYIVYGYPEEGTALDPNGQFIPVPYQIGCDRYASEPQPGELENYDPTYHRLLDYRRDATNYKTDAKERLPHPGGMSGCGVWHAYSADDVESGWRPEYARLIAIQSAWYADVPALRVAPIDRIRTAISHLWPELRPAFSIVGVTRPAELLSQLPRGG